MVAHPALYTLVEAMMTKLIQVESFQYGKLAVPSFCARRGEFVCLHVPTEAIQDAYQLPSLLVDASSGSCSTVLGSARYALRPMPRRGALGFWKDPPLLDWLQKQRGLSRETALALVQRYERSPRTRVGSLSNPARYHLGVEAALATDPDVFIFDGWGESEPAIEYAFNLVARRLSAMAVIYISFPCYGMRKCFPGAHCIASHEQESGQTSAA